MPGPSYEASVLAAFFQPVGEETLADPIAGPVLQRLAADDPDAVAAVADVDRSLIRAALAMTPAERLAASFRRARAFERLRRGDR